MRRPVPLVVAALLLVCGGVLLARPQVAVTGADLEALGPGPSLEAPAVASPPAGPEGATPAPADAEAVHAQHPTQLVLERDGTAGLRLGQPAAAAVTAGWLLDGRAGADGCRRLRAQAPSGPFTVQGWVHGGTVVVVQVVAPEAPGALLPTGARMGWSFEAVTRDAGIVGADPQRPGAQVAVQVLPEDPWPPTARSGFARTGTAGSTSGGGQVVELLLLDLGSQAVRAAAVRLPDRGDCGPEPLNP